MGGVRFGGARAAQVQNARTNDFVYILDTWEAKPLTDVVLVGSESSCPSGYTPLSDWTWPGVRDGPCACPRGAEQNGESESSSVGVCDSNQTAAGCDTAEPLQPVGIWRWMEQVRVCGRFTGSPSVSEGGTKERPRPVKGSCPSGFQKCGPANETYPRAFCMKSSEACPIVELEVDALATLQANNDSWSSVQAIPGTTLGLGARAGDKGRGLPYVDHTVGLGGTVCLGTDAGSVGKLYVQDTGSASFQLTRESCRLKDDRFHRYWSVDVSDQLNANIDAYSPDCLSAPDTEVVSLDRCTSGDSICENLNHLGRCEYAHRYADNEDGSVALTALPEIYWSPSCEISRPQIFQRENAVLSVRALQLTIMVINIMTGVFGMIVQLMLVYNKLDGNVPCIPGKGEFERKLILVMKTCVDGCCKLCKVVPEIFLIILVASVRVWFQRIDRADCSDSTTDATFSFIGVAVSSAYEANIRAVVIDLLLFLYAVYSPSAAAPSPRPPPTLPTRLSSSPSHPPPPTPRSSRKSTRSPAASTTPARSRPEWRPLAEPMRSPSRLCFRTRFAHSRRTPTLFRHAVRAVQPCSSSAKTPFVHRGSRVRHGASMMMLRSGSTWIVPPHVVLAIRGASPLVGRGSALVWQRERALAWDSFQ